MFKKLFAMLIAGLILLAPAGAAPLRAAPGAQAETWLPFAPGNVPAEPTLTLTAADADRLALTAAIPGAWAQAVTTAAGTYTRLSGDGFGHGTEPGRPDLPVLRRWVEIPFGAEVTVELLKVEVQERTLSAWGFPSPLYPLQPPVPKTPPAQGPPWALDRAFYQTDAFSPATPVRVTEDFVIRGHRIVAVEVWPVAYNPATGVLRLYSQVTFQLRLTGSQPERTEALARRYAAPELEALLAPQVLNYNQGRPQLAVKSTPGYLIITADAYYNAMLPFVALKTSQGYSVTMTRLSEISGGATPTAIQAYIQNAYQTWAIPPAFVLLVGDTDTIPAWTGPTISTATDLYYATMDATGTTDWHPDLGRGRFPVRSAAQATAMVNKYLAYASLTGEESWLKRIAFPATCDNYTVAEGTHNYVINTHTQPRGYTGTFPNNPQPGGDKLYCVTYGAQNANLVSAFNQGRWAIIYSGHGNYDGWEMSFSSNSVRNLTNNGLFPFVASHACLTGNFGQAEVFGETWVLQENKGALAYWGSSTYSYWGEDDILERRAFDALFGAGYPQVPIATMTNAGLTGVETTYPSSARYYWETYNILGDPALKLFPQRPQAPQLGLTKRAPAWAEAGTRLQYTLTLTNSGGPASGILISDTLPAHTQLAAVGQGGQQQGGTLVWSGLTLTAGGALSVTYDVTVTCVASGTLLVNDAYTVTATEWPTPTTGLPVTTTVSVAGVTADFSAPTPGVLNWAVPFTNLSQRATTFLWSFGDGATSPAFQPTHVYTATGLYTVTLAASNACHPAVTTTHTLPVVNYALALRPVTPALSGDSGTTVTYTLWLTNTGTAGDTFRLSRGSTPWATTFATDTLTLAPGAAAAVPVYVTIPAAAGGGETASVLLTARSQSDPRLPAASATVRLTTTAASFYRLAVSAPVTSQAAKAGEQVTYTISITNTGNVVDTFTVTRTTPGWPTTFSWTSLQIKAGGVRKAEVYLTVPAGSSPRDEALIRITGTGSYQDVTLTTQRENFAIYLPLVLRENP